MTNWETRLPKRVLRRYAELLLRHVHQRGGRDRYVRVTDIEHELGLEAELILRLCETRLIGEVQVAHRLPVELEEATEMRTPLEREWLLACYAQPHVRIRPPAVRLTADELVPPTKKRKN